MCSTEIVPTLAGAKLGLVFLASIYADNCVLATEYL